MSEILAVLGYAALTAVVILVVLFAAGSYACKRLRAANQAPPALAVGRDPACPRDLAEARRYADMVSRALSTKSQAEAQRFIAQLTVQFPEYRWWRDRVGRVHVDARWGVDGVIYGPTEGR